MQRSAKKCIRTRNFLQKCDWEEYSKITNDRSRWGSVSKTITAAGERSDHGAVLEHGGGYLCPEECSTSFAEGNN